MSQQPSHRAVTGMSRRNALITGAGAVVAGSAAAVAGSRLALGSGGADARAMPSATPLDAPVMLRLADARNGAFDVFVGTDVVHLVDNGFAAQVARAAGRSRR